MPSFSSIFAGDASTPPPADQGSPQPFSLDDVMPTDKFGDTDRDGTDPDGDSDGAPVGPVVAAPMPDIYTTDDA